MCIYHVTIIKPFFNLSPIIKVEPDKPFVSLRVNFIM